MSSIASLMWRKRRIQKKRQLDLTAEVERTENSVLWKHPLPLCDDHSECTKQLLATMSDAGQPKSRSCISEDYEQVFSFSCSLYREISATVLRITIQMLPDEFKNHLLQNCPELNYETTPHWVASLKREADTVLLLMIGRRYPAAESIGASEAASRMMDEKRLFSDLAAEERIERNIDQLLGRFFKLQCADELAAHKKNAPIRLLEGSLKSAKEREIAT